MNPDQNIERALLDFVLHGLDEVEHAAFLTRACADDSAMRVRLETMLAANRQAEAFFRQAEKAKSALTIDPPEVARAMAETPGFSDDSVRANAGKSTGRYAIIERIGEGGCGSVYLAEQLEPVKRTVALKVIRRGMDTARVIARFEQERQSLAMMDHSNIAHVLDAGVTEDGRPFFVMEHVDGEPITRFCDARRLSLRQRLELFIQICSAIQHAHQKGVIHRDIKPSNILVTLRDETPFVKVIDFGIAKATTPEFSASETAAGGEPWIGTPAYMSPEQASGGGVDVDTRSDVYSLGALLHELLAGHTPLDGKTLAAAGPIEARKILLESELPPPSAALDSLVDGEKQALAAARQSDPVRLAALIRGDLDWIVMRAMDKDRERRYDTVNGLAKDIQRHLDNEPVLARPPGRFYVARKFVCRNRLAVFSLSAVAAAIVLGLGFSIWAFSRERTAHQEQLRLRQIAETARAAEAALLERTTLHANISRAAVLLSEGKADEADGLLRVTPLSRIDPSREAAEVLRSLGMRNALRGRWKESLDCYSLLYQANRFDTSKRIIDGQDLLPPGPVWIEQGDFSGYERFRSLLLDSYAETTDRQVAEQVIKVTMLRPAEVSFLARVVPLQELVVQSMAAGGGSDEFSWNAFALALLEYRKGNFPSAIEWAGKSLEKGKNSISLRAMTEAVMAMARFRSGETEAAGNALRAARELVDAAFTEKMSPGNVVEGPARGYWWDWLIARILLREAEQGRPSPEVPDRQP